MAYLTYYMMTDSERRRSWRLLSWGGLLALVGYLGMTAAISLWANPMGQGPDGWIWSPMDWYGVFCCVLFASGPIGLALFLWAVANYRINRMVRLQKSGIARLDGAIRLWSLIFFIGGAILMGRMAFVSVRATFTGWQTGQARSLYLSNKNIVDVAFSPGGDLILATTDQGDQVAWSASRGKSVALPAGTPRVFVGARTRTLLGGDIIRLTTPVGKTALQFERQYSGNLEVTVLDSGGQTLRRLLGHNGAINAVALTPDGKLALTGSADRTVRLWDVDTGKELHCFRDHSGGVTCVQFAPGRAIAFSGDDKGYVYSWDLKQGSERPGFARERKHNMVGFLSVSADGRRLLSTGRRDGRSPPENLCLWDVDKGISLAELDGTYAVDEGPTALSPDGKWALTTGLNHVQFWRLMR